MNSCSGIFLRSLLSPFDKAIYGKVCFPETFSRPSQKLTSLTSVSITVGTSGFGFLNYAPTLTNDYNAGNYSGNTYAGTTQSITPTTGVSIFRLNDIPYTGAQLVAGTVSGRIVSCGIRVRCTASAMTATGSMDVLSDPAQGSILGSIASYLPLRNRKHCLWSREWVFLPIVPINQKNVTWSTAASFGGSVGCYPFSDSSVAPYFVGVYITGTAGSTYEVEIVQHMEFTGTQVNGQTPSHIGDQTLTAQSLAVAQSQSDDPEENTSNDGETVRPTQSLISKADQIVDVAQKGASVLHSVLRSVVGAGLVMRSLTPGGMAANGASGLARNMLALN